MGESWKFDDVSETVLEAVQKGHSQNAAAALAGITPETITGWKRIAKDTLAAGKRANKYTKWYARFLRAKGIATSIQEEALFKAGKEGSVQAAVKWLERQCPEEWGPALAVTVDGTLEIEGHLTTQSDEELRAGLKKALERANALAGESAADEG